VFFAVAAESQNSSGQTSLNSELGKLASSVSNASFAEVTSYGANFLEEMQISFASSVKFVEAVMEEKLSPKVSPACLKTKKSQRSVDASEC
jgi:hypothetical protein